MPTDDRRQEPRFEIAGGPPAFVQGIEPLRVHNLSREGVLIESMAPVPVGSVLAVQLINRASSFQLQATVRRQTPSRLANGEPRYLVGLEFINLDEPAKAWLTDVLAEQSEAASPDEA